MDDDGAPTLSINDVTVNEGAGTATFTVTLSAPSGLPVTVSYTTANGTATAGADFTTTSGVLNFGPGVVTQTISVPILERYDFREQRGVHRGLERAVECDDRGWVGPRDDSRRWHRHGRDEQRHAELYRLERNRARRGAGGHVRGLHAEPDQSIDDAGELQPRAGQRDGDSAAA